MHVIEVFVAYSGFFLKMIHFGGLRNFQKYLVQKLLTVFCTRAYILELTGDFGGLKSAHMSVFCVETFSLIKTKLSTNFGFVCWVSGSLWAKILMVF